MNGTGSLRVRISYSLNQPDEQVKEERRAPHPAPLRSLRERGPNPGLDPGKRLVRIGSDPPLWEAQEQCLSRRRRCFHLDHPVCKTCLRNSDCNNNFCLPSCTCICTGFIKAQGGIRPSSEYLGRSAKLCIKIRVDISVSSRECSPQGL